MSFDLPSGYSCKSEMQACGWHYRMTSHPERQSKDIRWADRVINTDRHWLRQLQTNLGSCRCGERPKHVQINTLKILWKTQASAALCMLIISYPRACLHQTKPLLQTSVLPVVQSESLLHYTLCCLIRTKAVADKWSHESARSFSKRKINV